MKSNSSVPEIRVVSAKECTVSDDLDFDRVLAEFDDFGLSNSVSCAIESTHGYDSLVQWSTTIPLPHRIVHMTWSISGFLECEGFARLMSLKCRHAAYADCFNAIGLPTIAATIREAIESVPAECLGDTDRLVSHFGNWGALAETVKPAQETLFASHDERVSSVARYIRENRTDFFDLFPAIQRQVSYLSKFDPEGLEEYFRIVEETMNSMNGK